MNIAGHICIRSIILPKYHNSFKAMKIRYLGTSLETDSLKVLQSCLLRQTFSQIGLLVHKVLRAKYFRA
jgi:hypothetical protein